MVPYPIRQVFVDPLTPDDLLYIATNKFPLLALPASSNAATAEGGVGAIEEAPPEASLLSRMISFNRRVLFAVFLRILTHVCKKIICKVPETKRLTVLNRNLQPWHTYPYLAVCADFLRNPCVRWCQTRMTMPETKRLTVSFRNL